ncbi:MAG TPA: restriction endonuclease subunit S [Thermoanaerobaculia bacterium]|nr:restriction endonuclease subunit S [Thermoanaerobaculia bacterium]
MSRGRDAAKRVPQNESELPDGWMDTVLEDLIVHALGGEWGEDPKAELPEGAELVRVSVLRGTEFRQWDREKGATAAERLIKPSSLARRRLAPGDLVVEISGGGPDQPVGRTLLVDQEAVEQAKNPLICSNFCRQIRLHPDIDPLYVQIVLRHRYLRGDFNRYQAQTTNIRNLNFNEFLAGVSVPVPPLAEQRRIAGMAGDLLGRVDNARRRLERMPGILKRFRQAVLAAAYAGKLTEEWRRKGNGSLRLLRADLPAWELPSPLEMPEVPSAWEILPLREVTSRVQYGLSLKADGEARGGIPMLRMGNIQDGRIDDSDLKYLDPEIRDLSSFLLARGDILFNRTNSPELVGKAAVYDLEREAVFASYLVRISCDERRVASRFLCGWINSPWGRWWARTVRTDGVSQSNISTSKLQVMPVPVPPLEEQREIVRRVEALFELAESIERRVAVAVASADRLTQAVLGAALRGVLVPAEATLATREGRDFEAAWTLLERVRAERENAGGATGGQRGRRGRSRPEPGEPAAPPGPPRLEDLAAEQVLALFRQACWGAGEMSEEELFRRVARRHGCKRLTKGLQARLREHLALAITRRIVGRAGDQLLVGATPNFARYEQEFLLQALLAVVRKGAEYERTAVCRAIAARLGYSQVTAAMRERMEEIFGTAIRMGLLEARGGRLARRG